MKLRHRVAARLGYVPMTADQMAYLSRAVFRHRVDAPQDEPILVASLDPHVSVWRDRLARRGSPDA